MKSKMWIWSLAVAVSVVANTGCTRVSAKLQEAQALVVDSSGPSEQALQRAKDIYQAVLKVDSSNPYALNNLAWLTIKTEDSQRKATLEKALAMFQKASANAVGKTASSFIHIVVFFPQDGSSTVEDVDVCRFAFLLRGVHKENEVEKTADILPVINANIFRTQYHLKSALEK